ncbi:hypothetical protein [Marispirochaeta aestuarii]|uniref:hypothetical protein n=1 Tax=Marispirochaeta aestuarii TaxID=1963862 RepID=UPI0029C7DCBC|nr:hypothetical protein [Marispirochaeta aestuarii]
MDDFTGIPRNLLPSPVGPRTRRPFLIAIDGIGTSGKSSRSYHLGSGSFNEVK